MKLEFSVVAKEKEAGWENTEHYRDELDVELFPTVVYESLPDLCLFRVMIFIDRNLNDWMSIVPIHRSTKEQLYIIWLKNTKIVDWEKIKGEK
ncbi:MULTISPECIES: hypothetical protein [Bacillus]|uniref:hypothetical protein n=1 Tax=Bacillus TaxID=1386 RepID=UPI000BEF7F2C|nr:hypothetical protein [Bacillus pseudomycoides]PEL25828.1 hypothetical protein CN608_13840 [Bacillus pseudomycoides]